MSIQVRVWKHISKEFLFKN